MDGEAQLTNPERVVSLRSASPGRRTRIEGAPEITWTRRPHCLAGVAGPRPTRAQSLLCVSTLPVASRFIARPAIVGRYLPCVLTMRG